MVRWYPEPTKPYVSAIHQSRKVLGCTYFTDDRRARCLCPIPVPTADMSNLSQCICHHSVVPISSYLESVHGCLSWPFQVYPASFFYTWRNRGPETFSTSPTSAWGVGDKAGDTGQVPTP